MYQHWEGHVTRQTRLKIALRFAAAAATGSVAVFVSSPLFAQARTDIAVTATVLAPPQPTAVTLSASGTVTRYSSTVRQIPDLRDSHSGRSIETREQAAKSEARQSEVVTIEYGAN